jgi:hypothetical protein
MAGHDATAGAPDEVADELTALRARNETLQASLIEIREGSNRRAIHAELRAEATRRGMVDLDGLKLIDHGAVTIDDDGVVHGVQSTMTKLRRDKPWLFGASSSSSVAGVPETVPARTKLATEMSLDEWRVARAALLRRG